MRPVGIAHSTVLDGLPLEAVEEEDDGHDEGRHQAPRHGPVQIRSRILKGKSNEMDNFRNKQRTSCMCADGFQNFCAAYLLCIMTFNVSFLLSFLVIKRGL